MASASRPASIGTGTLVLRSTTPCTVWLDDDRLGTLTPGAEHAVNLLAGTYTVAAEDDLGMREERTVDVKRGDTETLVLFERAAAPVLESRIIQPASRKQQTTGRRWTTLVLLAALGMGSMLAYRAGIVDTWFNATVVPMVTSSGNPVAHPANDPPVAAEDAVRVTAETPAHVAVLANDTDADGDSLRIARIVPPQFGSLAVALDSSSLTYTPPAGFTGTDRFRYAATDGLDTTSFVDVVVTVQASERIAQPAPPAAPAETTPITWIDIPAGSFRMGALRGGTPDARPARRVELSRPFRISAHEITVGQFRAFVEATGYRTDAERGGGAWAAGDSAKVRNRTWKNPGYPQTDNHPVVNVSWNDAVAFARWMDARLPTEAEWEYAARAGTTGNTLGDDPDSFAWYAENAESHPQPVGQKAPNAWGLYDVLGNALEWVQDWYAEDYYRVGARLDPKGPETGTLRICRGGSWQDAAVYLHRRNRASPGYRSHHIGFRIVQDLPVDAAPAQ